MDNLPHSTLKLLFGYEPCYILSNNSYKEYPNIFEVNDDNYNSFLNTKATIYQKASFWRHFSQRLWSFDDFNYKGGAAVSLLTDALRFKLWYNPKEIYRLLLCSLINDKCPFKYHDDKNVDGVIIDQFKSKWFDSKIEEFTNTGRLFESSYNFVSWDFWLNLIECEKQGKWIETAWKQHCNFLVTSEFYNKNILSIMQHEMLHIMWDHLSRLENRDLTIYNFATDYAINQQLLFSDKLKTLLVTDLNKSFYEKFVVGISLWRASISMKEKNSLLSLGITESDNLEELIKHKSKLESLFIKTKYGKNKYLDKDSDFYYEILKLAKNQMAEENKNDFSKGSTTLDDHDMWSKNDETPKDQSEVEDPNDKDDKDDKDEKDYEIYKKIICKNEVKRNFAAAAEKSGYDISDPNELNKAISEIPGISPLREMFNDWFLVKSKNYKKELRSFMRYCINPSQLDYSMIREHRALDDVFPGKRRLLGFELIIALDTSGSISNKDFNDFINQLLRISKDCDIERTRIIQCHTRISDDNYYKISSLNKLKKLSIKESGGTIMEPVFKKLKLERNKKPLILFTDGYIDSFSASKYKGFKHIIVLSRGMSHRRDFLEKNGFKVLCQDDE